MEDREQQQCQTTMNHSLVMQKVIYTARDEYHHSLGVNPHIRIGQPQHIHLHNTCGVNQHLTMKWDHFK